MVADVERRQELLCELDVRARLRSVLAEVSEVLARLAPAEARGTGELSGSARCDW